MRAHGNTINVRVTLGPGPFSEQLRELAQVILDAAERIERAGFDDPDPKARKT